MIPQPQIKKLIQQGEGQHVEFKLSVPAKVRELSEEISGFANTDGGFIIIGVDDKNNIVGANIDNNKRSAIVESIGEISPIPKYDFYSIVIDGKTLWVIEIPENNEKPYICSGSIFIRKGPNSQKIRTRNEMFNLLREFNVIYYDKTPSDKIDLLNNIEEKTFVEFCRRANISIDIDKRQLFEGLDCFDKQTGRPLTGALLFFANHPEKRFPHAMIRCIRLKGREKVFILDDQTYSGTLFEQYNKTLEWIQSKLELRIIVEGTGAHREEFEIPLDVFREALINALGHRDYYVEGATIMVEVYDDRIEISNPGGLLPEVAKNFGHRSELRNPLIFSLFTRMQLVEKIGSGIPRMARLMKEADLMEPEYNTEGMFAITIKRPVVDKGKLNVTENVTEKYKSQLSDRQIKIIEIIQANPDITTTVLSEKLKVSRMTIHRDISELTKLEILHREGSDKKGKWIISRKIM